MYFTDDRYGRYNYSGTFEEGEISSLGRGITYYRNGDTYRGQYSGQGDKRGLPEGRGVLKSVDVLLVYPYMRQIYNYSLLYR